MALKTCPKCQSEVRKVDARCWKCKHRFTMIAEGQPQQQSNGKGDTAGVHWGWGCLLLTAIGLVFLLSITRGCSTSPEKKLVSGEKGQSAAVAASTIPAKQTIDFPHLKPATRFSEYGIGEEHRAAQNALNAGDVARAYNMFGERNRSLDGPREKRFDDVLETAFQQWSNSSPASDFAERVQTYWLPQLKALPTTPPADTDAYGKRLSAIQEFAQDVADAEGLTFSPAQLQLVAKFRAALSAKQIALFPILRRRYAELLNEKLFRSDIDVRIAGPAARTLRLTSGAFALNANIEDMQTAIGSDAARTRFRRVEYGWSRYLNDGYHYDLTSPGDGEIGLWDAGAQTFTKIPGSGASKHTHDPLCNPALARQVGLSC